MRIDKQSLRWSDTACLRTWLTVFAAAALSACAAVEIPREKSYPGGWPAIVSLGSECRGIEGTYENKGTGVRADASGEPRSIWFTDLFHQFGVWARARSGFPAYEVVKQDLHACDRMTISIESIPRSERPISDPSSIRVIINPSRLISPQSSDERMPCMPLAVPESRGYAFPHGGGHLYCQATSVFYAGQHGTVNGFDLYIARAADGSLVTFKRELLEPEFWARFLKLPE